ncbi:NHL repeat-containing protein [Hydrogenophaga sp.]|uniref:NHL repeat-containing protein n=1 Tax=Hydrogenophaga sp. TaxID=1904254 RepID=UPI002722B80E|nr:NHL repeat-containing protein [Hydrogenophaga sp.]MDO9434308.1 NHL repeat-containing protein [Hydrogenophaga sp.]
MSTRTNSLWRLGAMTGAIVLLVSCGGGDVGVTVSGLSGTLVLQNNGGDDLTIKANGEFRFPTGVKPNTTYSVTVRTQPFWQNCTVGQGSGNTSATVSNVTIACASAQARVSTLAGSGIAGKNNGNGGAASFNSPVGVAVRPDGSLLVADSVSNLLRSVSPTGDVTTLAGGGPLGSVNGNGSAASFNTLLGLALEPGNDVYAAEFNGNRIRRITPAGDVSTVAGNGAFSSLDGNGTAATFNRPQAVARHASGDLYVVENGGAVVRKITPGGDVSTLAGSGLQGFAEGNGTAASFQSPSGVAVDAAGNVYVADFGNRRVRKITPAGVVSTLAGSGLLGKIDGMGASASFVSPAGLAIDPDGNVYVADFSSNQVRMITPAGLVSTLAGNGPLGAQDGVGPAATFSNPKGIAIGPDGTLYVADTFGHKIRKLVPVR